MANLSLLLTLSFLSASAVLMAADPSPLRDFCVGSDPTGQGNLICKDPKLVEANDFFFSGLHIAAKITSAVGSTTTNVFAAQLPGLNTLGVAMTRVDIALGGVNPPHTHPRATEVVTILEGVVEAGFITSNPENRHFRKVLRKGDVFVVPIGLVHYQRNIGYGSAVIINSFNSQNPGSITVSNALFGATPEIANEVFIKGFHLDNSTINYLKSKF